MLYFSQRCRAAATQGPPQRQPVEKPLQMDEVMLRARYDQSRLTQADKARKIDSCVACRKGSLVGKWYADVCVWMAVLPRFGGKQYRRDFMPMLVRMSSNIF